jgi:hypothetical protein
MLKRVDPSGVGQDPNRRAIVGLLADRAEGTRRIYRLDDEGIAAVREYLERGWREPRPGSGSSPRTPANGENEKPLERAARDRVRGRLLAPARHRRPG